MQCKTMFIRVIFAIVLIRSSLADVLDDAMDDALNNYNVRGASIAYFDRVSSLFNDSMYMCNVNVLLFQ